MTDGQVICLLFMFCIGFVAIFGFALWKELSRRKRFLIIAWLIFWIGPPLYFIWTKGVMG